MTRNTKVKETDDCLATGVDHLTLKAKFWQKIRVTGSSPVSTIASPQVGEALLCHKKEVVCMAKSISNQKLSKKAKKEVDSRQRTTWSFSPVTKKIESKELYNRKKKSTERYGDYGSGLLFFTLGVCKTPFLCAFSM